MKKLIALFVGSVLVSALVHAAISQDECYKRCMEKANDKTKCKEICYPKN